jgi:tetratricopeptide (TPR) repeat protein
MYRYWSSRHSSEGITMLRRLAAVAVPERLAPLRAEVLDDLGALLLNFGEPEEAREPLTAALTVARSGHDPKLIGQVLADLAECSRVTGELVTALELADEALEHFQQASYERGIAAVLARRGLILSAQGDFVTARRAYERCLDALSASESDVLARAEVLHNLAIAELAVEEHDAAVRHLDEAFGIAEDTDDAWGRAVVSCTRALIHVLDGEPRPARSRYAESIVAARDQPIPWLACYCLLGFALVASLEGHDQRAATLLGACDAHTERLGLALEPVEARLRRSETDRLTRSLGSATFDECYREGTKFDLQRAVAFALGTDVADERSAKDPLPD